MPTPPISCLWAWRARSFELIQQGRGGGRPTRTHISRISTSEGQLCRRRGPSHGRGTRELRPRYCTQRIKFAVGRHLSVFGVATCFIVWIVFMRRSFQEQQRLHEASASARNETPPQRPTQLKARFLASMSHELRTPLRAVIGYSEMLREGAEEDKRRGSDYRPEQSDWRSPALHCKLIDDLLDLSKAEIGKIVLKARDSRSASLVGGRLNYWSCGSVTRKSDARQSRARSRHGANG